MDREEYLPRLTFLRRATSALDSNQLSLLFGFDGVDYGYKLKRPYLCQVLATTFTKIRGQGVAHYCWGSSKIVLIKKQESKLPKDATYKIISLLKYILYALCAI